MTNTEREIIISYQKELYLEAQETQELYGVQDEAAKRLMSQWYVISELLERLEAQ